MSSLKRKASRASPFEPSIKMSREKSSSGTPGLRRAPTLTLEDKDSSSSSTLTGKKSLSKKGSIAVGEVVTVPSLPKVASIVEGDDVVTTLTRLPSGASIGCTTSFSTAPGAISKELSSSSSSKTPLIAKGISKGGSIILDVPSLSKAKSKSKSSVEEPEAGVALEKVVSLSKSLSKPTLTKEKSASMIVAAAEEAAEEAAVEAEEAEEEEESAVTRDIPLPPGGLMEIVFSFDTTGSMYSCLDQVRNRIQDMVQRLQADIPGIRIAIFAHGDYCDKSNYIVKWIDFGASAPEICKFVREVDRTGGGDFPEAYEVVLRRCQSVLSWTPGSQRSLVMIGDATPHEASDPQNEENIDWKTECQALKDFGVRIYSVQALNNSQSNVFYKTMATITRGLHLKLDQFSNVFDIIMAICYRERGDDFLEAYEDEVRDRYGGGALHRDLEGVFGTLKDDAPTAGAPVKKTTAKKGAAKAKKTTAKADTAMAKAVKKVKKIIMAKGASKKVKGVTKTKTAAKKKGTAKKTKKVKKAKKEKVSKKADKNKLPRENVFDGKFAFGTNKMPITSDTLQDINWSQWNVGMVNEKKTNKNFKPRANGPGYVYSNLFRKQNDVQAVYEVGVRPPLSFRKRVFALMMKHTRGFENKRRWDRYLLSSFPVQREVAAILVRGGAIMVRRGIIPDGSDRDYDDAVKVIQDKYDYAWNKHATGSRAHRVVRKSKGFLISGAACCDSAKAAKKAAKTPKAVKTSKKTTAKKTTKKAAKAKPKTAKGKGAKAKKPAKGKKGKGKKGARK